MTKKNESGFIRFEDAELPNISYTVSDKFGNYFFGNRKIHTPVCKRFFAKRDPVRVAWNYAERIIFNIEPRTRKSRLDITFPDCMARLWEHIFKQFFLYFYA